MAPVAPSAAHTKCRSSKTRPVRPLIDSASSAFIRLTTIEGSPSHAPGSIAHRQRSGPQAGPQVVQLPGFCCARRAFPQVRLDGDLIADRQLAVVERGQLAPHLPTCSRHHDLSASLSWARSASRARVSRDFTVPTATPSENAISS